LEFQVAEIVNAITTKLGLPTLKISGFPQSDIIFDTPIDTKWPSPLVICSPISHFSDLLGKLENAALDQCPEGWCLTAKRIDYLVGDQYAPGNICNLPIVGGASNIAFKKNLDEIIDRKDWARAIGDVMVVVPIVIAPLIPMTGGAAIAGWVAANAAFGAMTSGITEYAASGDQGNAMQQAGKGALIGAVTGLAGGFAVAKVLPGISNQLVAHTAAGSLTGTAVSTTEATMRVIERGEDLGSAAKEITAAALEGAVVGGGAGTLSFGLTKIVRRLSASSAVQTTVNDGLKPDSIKELLAKTRLGPYCMSKTDGFFIRLEGHVNQLGDTSGVRQNLSIMAGKNLNAAKGRFTELGAAAAFKKAGHDICAIGKVVNVPGLGKTDIDLLTRSGKWIEKKHVQKIANTIEFRTKIDKMAEALRSGMEVKLADGSIVKINDALFVNSKKISSEALRYAEGKGVKIYQNTPYTQVPL
jgi:hypothetical protein